MDSTKTPRSLWAGLAAVFLSVALLTSGALGPGTTSASADPYKPSGAKFHLYYHSHVKKSGTVCSNGERYVTWRGQWSPCQDTGKFWVAGGCWSDISIRTRDGMWVYLRDFQTAKVTIRCN